MQLSLRHPALAGECHVALHEWHPADGDPALAARPRLPRRLSAYSLDLRCLA